SEKKVIPGFIKPFPIKETSTDPEKRAAADKKARDDAELQVQKWLIEDAAKVSTGQSQIQSAVRAVLPPDDPSQSVSLTASFFLGGDVKDAGRKLGLADCNTEDALVFDAIRKMKSEGREFDLRVERVNADPNQVLREVWDSVAEWAKAKRVTDQWYIDA